MARDVICPQQLHSWTSRKKTSNARSQAPPESSIDTATGIGRFSNGWNVSWNAVDLGPRAYGRT